MQEVEATATGMGSMLMAAHRMARRYGRIGLLEPDDLVQEAMLKVLRKRDGKYPTPGWLFMAVRCSAIDAGRRATRERQFMICKHQSDAIRVCEQADEYRYLCRSSAYMVREDDSEVDLMPGLKNVLEKLSKPLKQVLVLYSQGHSYREIAELTNTNIGTVRSRLHYARRRAKSLLGDMT